MFRARLIIAATLIAFTSMPAMAAPPTDEQIDSLIARVVEAGKDGADPAERAKAQREIMKGALEDISWGEVSATQFDRLATKGLLRPYPDVCKASFPRLKELSTEPTVAGARCADVMMACWPQPTDAASREADTAARCDALLEALKHPKMADLCKAGKGGNLIRAVSSFPPEMVRERKLIEAVEPYITTDLSPVTASSLGGVFDAVTSEEYAASPEFSARIRQKIAAAALAASGKDDPRLADDPKAAARTRASLKDLAATCNSAFARGELLDHAAPPIAFTWTNYPTALKSFDDLKGKVVLVDFWATWCGPCVGAFPKMRTLAAHYKGYPVVILGVTSDQGFHIARSLEEGSKTERIECDGDTKKEHGLMTQFVKDMDMTWPVAFSEQNVFNPDFGVRGIPHLAIIDPSGKVRHNGLRPGNSAEEAEKIDAILTEFKMQTPAGKIGEEK